MLVTLSLLSSPDPVLSLSSSQSQETDTDGLHHSATLIPGFLSGLFGQWEALA